MKRAKQQNKFLTGLFAVLAYLGWDAGQRWSESRGQVGWPSGGVQDPVDVNTPMERLEIIRKAQQFERNSSIANRLIDVFEQYTVGAGGMPVTPASSDEEWNRERKILWNIWCKNPDLTSLQDFGTLQGLISRRWFVDGEVFIFKTRSDRAPFRPRIQLIESHRVQTPPDSTNPRIVDGIELDSKGRPVRYWVRNKRTNAEGHVVESYEPIDAKFIYHVHEPMRPGELRSFSFFAPVLNDLQDLEELCALAMAKAKEAAHITNVYNTETGELPASEAHRRSRFNVNGQTATGTEVSKERIEHIRQVTGSRTIGLKVGEKIEQLKSESPNQVEQAHWDIRINRICAGVGISKIFVFPNSMQGTVVRADLDIATTFFHSRSAVIQAAIQDIYEYVTEEEAKFERTIADKPHDWRNCNVRPPRSPNVDVGYNSAALIAEYEAGITNLHMICLPRGLDPLAVIRQRAKEEAAIDRIAAEEGTTPERIRSSIGEFLKERMESETKAREEEDKIAA